MWTNCVEAYSRGKAGMGRWVNRGEEGRKQVCCEEMKSRVLDSDFKVRGLKKERKTTTNKYKQRVSHNIFRRKLSKILEFCQSGRESARAKADEKVRILKIKYGGMKDEFDVPVEIREFSKCEMFQKNAKMKSEDPSGPVIVCDEGEELDMSKEEWIVLSRGPKFCMVRNCDEENMRVEVETAVLKHKWDCMSHDDEDEVVEENLSEEERIENERVAQLAEEMSAQTRLVYDSEQDKWDTRGLRVTDYI